MFLLVCGYPEKKYGDTGGAMNQESLVTSEIWDLWTTKCLKTFKNLDEMDKFIEKW